MILDSQNQFSDAQALTGTSAVASTNIIDLGSDRNIGIGEPLAVVVTVDVTAGGTTPSLVIAVQADDNSGFSSAGTVFTAPSLAAAALVAGAKFVYLLPADTSTERYIRLSYTQSGTSPTVTVTAFLQPASAVQNEGYFPDSITIS
jgi:hypothetical protein